MSGVYTSIQNVWTALKARLSNTHVGHMNLGREVDLSHNRQEDRSAKADIKYLLLSAKGFLLIITTLSSPPPSLRPFEQRRIHIHPNKKVKHEINEEKDPMEGRRFRSEVGGQWKLQKQTKKSI